MDDNTELITNEANKVPESPKPMAFTIDFGAGKSIDTQRHKNLVEKYQKRHRRGQSLSKLEDSPTSSASGCSTKKHPLSANLPRKSNLQSPVYSSLDEKCDKTKSLRNNFGLRGELSLPLKNINSEKIALACIESPDVDELRNIVTPDLDIVSPPSPLTTNAFRKYSLQRQFSSPECDEFNIRDEGGAASRFDSMEADKSDTASDAGTYTLDADKYSAEQKARMSIDRDFKIETVSVFRKTQEYVESLAQSDIAADEEEVEVEEEDDNAFASGSFDNTFVVDEMPQKPQMLTFTGRTHKLSPIVSPTQNFSIVQTGNEINDTKAINNVDCNKTFTKIMFPSPKARCGMGLVDKVSDQGNIISITSSGAFRAKSDKLHTHMRKLSLTKSEVHVETYTDNGVVEKHEVVKPRSNLSANLILVSENLPKTVNDKIRNTSEGEEVMHTNVPVGKVVNLPPPVGGISGKLSPTKIPSPIHVSRPRSRNSSNLTNFELSDSSLETESYLKPTQHLLNSLQQRLSLDSDNDSDSDGKYLNNDARNLLKKPTHMRHNSLDDRNLKISNKLEHFQNKNFIDQTYTNVLNQYSQNKVHKIQNSPNNSPIRRSSSFSTKNQINSKCTNVSQKDLNIRNSPNFSRNGSIQRSSSTAAIRPGLLLRRSSINSDHKIDRNQFGDTESSSEDDLKQALNKRKDITSTRYNRAFSLRRGRLDTEPTPPQPKCPNTPEMRRKFQSSESKAEQRAISVDRKTGKTSEVQSRYLLNLNKNKNAAVQPKTEVKGSPKIGNTATKPAPKSQVFSRTDTGRFSMRTSKPPTMNSQKPIRKDNLGTKKPSGPRSNSTLTSKEVEFQNWKRRKSYDPMKAAAEGKRKAELAKKQMQNSMTQSYHESNQDCDSSPSHSSSVHRSQSFHGTAALEQYISSEEEEDLTLSADEGFSPPTPSPCELSPKRLNLRYNWKEQNFLH